ncbi:MAG: DUF4147 domain-containing protein [Deltaproteobacteria bacterium]|nr:DUF4147 domain-containing protein [Deltaproteobacteria bacterium]
MQASRDGAIQLWRSVLERCDASKLIVAHLAGTSAERRPRILSLGKAAGALLCGAAEVLPGAREGALVVQTADAPELPGVECLAGDHPVAGEASLRAGRRVLEWVEAAQEEDAEVWVLLSGGASALVELPRPGPTLAELQQVQQRLLTAGVDIDLQNAVRARLSQLKGGGLAEWLGDSLKRLLVLVDIPAGTPELVGSGLCSPLPPWPGGLAAELERRGLLTELPDIVQLILREARSEAPEATVWPEVLATPRTMVELATHDLLAAGVRIAPASGARAHLEGRELADELVAHLQTGEGALIVAGEASCDRGSPGPASEARGGRAAHLALEVLDRMAGVEREWVFLAGASDLKDGSGEGGAVVAAGHPASAEERRAALEGWSSADFHRRFGSALPGGAPRTNLCDLYLAWC